MNMNGSHIEMPLLCKFCPLFLSAHKNAFQNQIEKSIFKRRYTHNDKHKSTKSHFSFRFSRLSSQDFQISKKFTLKWLK